MDESQLPNLKKCTRKVVHKASQPGGMLEKDEFTMAVARRLITEAMGLAEGSLDGKEWKKVVKDEVTAALVRPVNLQGSLQRRRVKGHQELMDRLNRNHRYQSPSPNPNPNQNLKLQLSLNLRRQPNPNLQRKKRRSRRYFTSYKLQNR